MRDVDISTGYNLKKIGDEKYSLSIKSSLSWFGGFILFIFFFLWMSSLLLPMGYSLKKYLGIVIPVLIFFTLIAIIAGIVFKIKAGKRYYIFDKKEHKIKQPRGNMSSEWTELKLPETGVMVRDSYKSFRKIVPVGLSSSAISDSSYSDTLVIVPRLMIIPIDKYTSAEDVLKKLGEYRTKFMNKVYKGDEKPPLPKNAILLDEGGFEIQQDLLIEGLMKIFDYDLIDFMISPPEYYTKESMIKATPDKILKNMGEPEGVKRVREKVKNGKLILKINRIPWWIRFIVWFFMGLLSAFYGFFASMKGDAGFWQPFFYMFSMWFVILMFNIRIVVTRNIIYKTLTLFGISVYPKIKINTADVGDIKIFNDDALAFYKKGSRQEIMSLKMEGQQSRYIAYRIAEFLKYGK